MISPTLILSNTTDNSQELYRWSSFPLSCHPSFPPLSRVVRRPGEVCRHWWSFVLGGPSNCRPVWSVNPFSTPAVFVILLSRGRQQVIQSATSSVCLLDRYVLNWPRPAITRSDWSLICHCLWCDIISGDIDRTRSCELQERVDFLAMSKDLPVRQITRIYGSSGDTDHPARRSF